MGRRDAQIDRRPRTGPGATREAATRHMAGESDQPGVAPPPVGGESDQPSEHYEPLDAESLDADPQSVAVVGRVMASRSFGKLMFLRILEAGESIQVSAKKNQCCKCPCNTPVSVLVGMNLSEPVMSP